MSCVFVRLGIVAAITLLVVGSTGAKVKDSRSKKLIIAHRGACGYLPEHTLAAKAMAYAMGADYIEQDLVMTKDDHLVVLHDHYLDRVTNVAKVFPERKRTDGRYYVIDFTLAEIKSLEVTEGFDLKDGRQVPNYPQRFPLWKSSFRVNTFAEEIELIQGLNRTTGRVVGIYPEIKSPWFHRREEKDISVATLRVLKEYGYNSKSSPVFLQCFDPNETRRIHDELFDQFDVEVRLVQLIAETDWNETMIKDDEQWVPYDYSWMFRPGAMRKIAQYADGIGPWKPMIVKDDSIPGQLNVTPMLKDAHDAGLVVHPYTFRLDEGRIPGYAKNFDDLLDIFLYQVGVDGLFTDFPDKGVQFLNRHAGQLKSSGK